MQKQADFDVRGAQIVQQLLFVGRPQDLPGFSLDDHSVVHEQVVSVGADDDSLVCDFGLPFFYTAMAARAQLYCERSTIHGLEKTESEQVITLVEGADDLARQLSLEQ
jgi:hypothetical protein